MKIPHDEISEILRTTNMKAKLSWLLHLLKLPRMAVKKQRFISQIMDLRNGFVHYKWKFQDIDEDRTDKDIESASSKVDGLVKYIKQYERKNIIHFSNTNLRRLLRRIEKAQSVSAVKEYLETRHEIH